MDQRTDRQTDGRTDGWTHPLIEMLGASKNQDLVTYKSVSWSVGPFVGPSVSHKVLFWHICAVLALLPLPNPMVVML